MALAHLRLLGIVLVVLGAAGACGGKGDRSPARRGTDPGPDTEPTSTGTSQSSAGSCVPGTRRECKVDLPPINGVANCFVGEQACLTGEWGDCRDPEDVDALLVDAGFLEPDAGAETSESDAGADEGAAGAGA